MWNLLGNNNLWCIPVLLCVVSVEVVTSSTTTENRPNIVFILADDLGWNDVGFHGSSQIPTPNLDALALSGIMLHKYYVNPICTPSRSALMTGKYPIHTGMQHGVIYGMERRGLPLTEKILPEYLKELGYSNHIVGKWHLGHYKKEYTPLHRGFETHLGYWTGHQDYYDHTAAESGVWGYDMRRNMTVAYDLHGQYATDTFSQESTRIIERHDRKKPLFLYVAHAAVHSGNPYEPLRAPDDTIAKMQHIEDYNRRKFAAMVSKMDDSVGDLVKALQKKDMLSNTIIVFSTDNGGPAEGFNLNAASNWPLRGVKNTLWEGGVRGAGFIWSSSLIKKPKRVSQQMMQIADWLPTLYAAAGADPRTLNGLDGVDLWRSLTADEPSNRTEILHNIDDIFGNSALTIGKWKVLNGTTYSGGYDGWYGPSGDRESISYSYNELRQSDAGNIMFEMGLLPTPLEVTDLRDMNNIKCYNNISTTTICKPLKEPCLFDIENDPCELNNLAGTFPNILDTLLKALEKHKQSAVPPNNTPLDRNGDPAHWNYVWTNFGDSPASCS